MEPSEYLEKNLLAERGWKFYIGCSPFEIYELQLKAHHPDKHENLKNNTNVLNAFIYKELMLHDPKFQRAFGYSSQAIIEDKLEEKWCVNIKNCAQAAHKGVLKVTSLMDILNLDEESKNILKNDSKREYLTLRLFTRQLAESVLHELIHLCTDHTYEANEKLLKNLSDFSCNFK